jgi:hypothetical protein
MMMGLGIDFFLSFIRLFASARFMVSRKGAKAQTKAGI